MANSTETKELLKSYALTQEDIDLITFALRRLAKTTGMAGIKADSENLINYIERENKNH